MRVWDRMCVLCASLAIKRASGELLRDGLLLAMLQKQSIARRERCGARAENEDNFSGSIQEVL